MKIIVKIITLFVTSTFLLSCSLGGNNTNYKEESDDAIADKTFDLIISALALQDESLIIDLFAEGIQDEVNDLQEEACDFIKFIHGNIVSVSTALEAGVGTDYKIEDGKMRKEIDSSFCVETTQDTYFIAIKECVNDTFDSRNIGLVSIYVIKSEDWNKDYIYRGDGKWIPGINIVG